MLEGTNIKTVTLRESMLEKAISSLPNPVLRPKTPVQKMLEKEIRVESRAMSCDSESDVDEFDTDIEMEEKLPAVSDNNGVATYVQVCKKLKLSPIRQVCVGLKSSEKIYVCNRGISSRAALSIANSLLINVNITQLALDGNNIDSTGIKYLCWMFTENMYLQSLSLNDNSFGTEGLLILCETLAVNTTVQSLHLAGNNFNDLDAIHFTKLLTVNTILQELDLSYNSFGDEGASYIAHCIANNDYLKILNLSWNKIRPLGIVTLAKAVQENVTLKSLNLSMNGLALDGCIALSAALKVNDSLTNLNISNTRLHDKDASKLVSALAKNESLVILDLSYNTISPSVIVALLKALIKNEGSGLQTFIISGIPIVRAVLFFAEQLQISKTTFQFVHGEIVKYNGMLAEEERNFLADCNPIAVLKWFMKAQNYSVKDLCVEDGSCCLTSAQFSLAVKNIGLPMSEVQIQKIFKEDGTKKYKKDIDIKEMLERTDV